MITVGMMSGIIEVEGVGVRAGMRLLGDPPKRYERGVRR
jgi:hypothetical protein